MITFGICLIYYGIALFLYQVHGWINYGVWVPFPVSRAWEGFFGAVRPSDPAMDMLVNWLLSWPMSLALLVVGFGILGLVFFTRRAIQLRRDSVRRKWILDQCAKLGYRPWAVPKVLRELDDRIQAEKMTGREETG